MTLSNMIIRPAHDLDIPTLIEFQKKMGLETENVVIDDGLINEGMQNLFSDPSKGKYYVAEIDKKLAGCLMTTFEWSEWRNGNVLWIQSVYTAEEFRGKGVYKAMYAHIQGIVLNDPTLRGIRLYADKSNKSAHDVYSRLGMNGDHYTVYEWMKENK
jgi:GNAT superfamily N-acetyltransferase